MESKSNVPSPKPTVKMIKIRSRKPSAALRGMNRDRLQETSPDPVTKVFASPEHSASRPLLPASPFLLASTVMKRTDSQLEVPHPSPPHGHLAKGKGGPRKSINLPAYVSSLLGTDYQRRGSRIQIVNRKGKKHMQLEVSVIARFHEGEVEECKNATVHSKTKTQHDIRMITEALSKHFIFTDLPENNLQEVIDEMKFYRLPSREIVFKQGELAVNFFILASGRVEVIANNRQVKILKEGDSFGELALLHDTPRSATVRSLETCTLWGLGHSTFRDSLRAINARKFAENKAFINSIELFSALTLPQKESLVHAFVSHVFPPGHRIVNEGDPGDLFYIVKEGVVVCLKGGVEIRRLSKGEFFGEQALLYTSGVRTATVVSEGPVKCVSIGRTDLAQVLGSHLQHIIYKNTQLMAIEKSPILSRLSKDQVQRLISNMTINTYSNDQVVIPKGTLKGSGLWIVLMGSLGNETLDVKTGTCFGDTDIMENNGSGYEADIKAQGKEVHIAMISIGELESCIGGSLYRATINVEAMSALRRVPILRGLPYDRFRLVVSMLEVHEYQPDEVILQQGEKGAAFFIIRSGQVNIIRDGVSIRIVSKLDYFGERALLMENPRTATVMALGPVSCWVLNERDFERFLTEDMRKRLLSRIDQQDDSITLRDLIIVKLLGKGMFGNVFLASHPTKEVLYALKTVTRAKIDQYSLHENLFLEKNILMQLDHTFIVSLIKTFKDEKRFYFLMEFVKGLDLFDALRKMGLLNEDDSRFYVAALILMMEHLHERNIIYRDLKPENVMVDEDGYPKLIDFGTAKIVANRTYTVIGTPHYMAPEVIMGKGYSTTADFYGIGVLLYEFICGKVPFGEDEDDPYAIYQKVLQHHIAYPDFLDSKFPAKALIEQLLNTNPGMRTGGGIEQLKSHRWFSGYDWVSTTQDRLYSREIRPPYTPMVSNINREVAIARVKRPTIDVIEV